MEMLRQLWSEERKRRRKTFCNSFFFYLRFEWSSNFFYTRWIPLRGHTHTQQKKSLLQSWLPFFLLGTATGNFTCLIPLSLFFWNGWKFGILNPCARERENANAVTSLLYGSPLCTELLSVVLEFSRWRVGRKMAGWWEELKSAIYWVCHTERNE